MASQTTPVDDNATTLTTLTSTNYTDGGYDYEPLNGIDSRYECPICLFYLRDPLLTTCGHRFCSGCMTKWVINKGKVCPVDGGPLSVENIFPDNYTRREILQCLVKCPYSKDGSCNVTLALCEMEKHVQSEHDHHSSTSLQGSPSTNGKTECTYRDVGCVAVFNREDLGRHLDMDVHHHLQLLTAAYMRLKKMISSHSSLEYMSPEFLTRQDSRESTRWLLAEDTDSDDYQFRRQKSWDSVRYARNKYNLRPLLQERLAECDESMNSKLDSRRSEKDCKTDTSNVHTKEIFERLVRLEQNDREKQIKLEALENKFSSAVHVFSTVTRLMDDLTARYCHGVYVWKITGFRQLCLDMRKNPNRVLNSPGFYTSTFGYKLCLRFNLCVIPTEGAAAVMDTPLEQDEETFASLYVHFLRGEFDDTLKWPFKGEMKLMIVHPNIPEDSVIETMYSKPESASFAKPTLPRNPKGFGYEEFVNINKVFGSGFVNHNTLICKIIVKSAV